MVKSKSKSKAIRAVGYDRTSGAGQRDNTSIPRQKESIEKFIQSQEGWQFLKHYVDESKSGGKIDGRIEFQQMIIDAANNNFDVVVIYDIDRFARDGSDIITQSNLLKKNFAVDTVDTKNNFDTRDHQKVMMKFVHAGMAEQERLGILDRTIKGRIATAKNGTPWTPKFPAGREFIYTDKKNKVGYWQISEYGYTLQKLLLKYANGESLKSLAKEYGIKSAQNICRNVRQSQLSGIYQVTFKSPLIGIHEIVSVPAIPQIITSDLEKRVRDRMGHNTVCNKQAKRKYLLTGFLKCTHCGKSLKSQTTTTGIVYYRHHYYDSEDKKTCSYKAIRGDVLESQVLDYLYSFFLDEPSFNRAVKEAIPSGDDRKALVKDIKRCNNQLVKVNKEINNLVNAIAAGADISLFLDKQAALKTERTVSENRLVDLKDTLLSMPNPELVKEQALSLRLKLVQQHKNKDWRSIPYDDVRQFLHFLFSDNPKKNGFGITVGKIKNSWCITFNGSFDFHHDIINGRPVSHALSIQTETLNTDLRRSFEKSLQDLTPDNDNLSCGG